MEHIYPLLDPVLKELASKPHEMFDLSTKLNDIATATGVRSSVVSGILTENNLATQRSVSYYQVTKEGIKAVQLGGLSTYFRVLLEREEEEVLHQQLIRDKERDDAFISKWNKKLFWWVISFAFLGGSYTILQIVLQVLSLFQK